MTDANCYAQDYVYLPSKQGLEQVAFRGDAVMSPILIGFEAQCGETIIVNVGETGVGLVRGERAFNIRFIAADGVFHELAQFNGCVAYNLGFDIVQLRFQQPGGAVAGWQTVSVWRLSVTQAPHRDRDNAKPVGDEEGPPP